MFSGAFFPHTTQQQSTCRRDAALNHHKHCKNHTECFINVRMWLWLRLHPLALEKIVKTQSTFSSDLQTRSLYAYTNFPHIQTFYLTYQYYKRATRQRFLRFLHRKRPSAPWWLRLCVRVSVGVPARTTLEPASIAAAVQLRWFQVQRNRGTSCPFTEKKRIHFSDS